jgi:hypothetical protein
MRVFAIGIEHSRDAPIKRLQGRDTGKLDRPAVFGRQRQDSAAVVTDGASRSDFGTVFPRWATASRSVVSLAPSASTIGSANRLSQDTTQLRNRTGIQADPTRIVPTQMAMGGTLPISPL